MDIKSYCINKETLVPREKPVPPVLEIPGKNIQYWYDIASADSEELRSFLEPLDLHPLFLERCLDATYLPGVNSFQGCIMMEFPAAFELDKLEPAYIIFVLKDSVLVTIREGAIPVMDDLSVKLTGHDTPRLHHLPQLVYLILDELADQNVEEQINVRERIQRISNTLLEDPMKVSSRALADLRGQVDKLVSLFENQLYCVTGLNACDNPVLQEEHRKAYLQDLVSEAEIAQRGIYRLESRMTDLYNQYQMAGNDRVERRLRFLTIVSAITLPLGLIAGLLGMNVGGLPGTTSRYGFLIVIALMLVIMVGQFIYFKIKGWFE